MLRPTVQALTFAAVRDPKRQTGGAVDVPRVPEYGLLIRINAGTAQMTELFLHHALAQD